MEELTGTKCQGVDSVVGSAGEKENNTYYIAGKKLEYEKGKTPSSNVSDVRYRFYFIGESLYFVPKEEERPTAIIYTDMLRQLHYDEDAFDYENCVRGWLTKDSICVYKTSFTIPIPPAEVAEISNLLLQGHRYMFGYSVCDIAVWTGCLSGQEGTVWPPIALIGKFDRFGEYKEL